MFLTSSWFRDGILTRSPNPGPYKSFASPFLHCPSYPSRDKEHEVEWVRSGGRPGRSWGRRSMFWKHRGLSNNKKSKHNEKNALKSPGVCSTSFPKAHSQKALLSLSRDSTLCIWEVGEERGRDVRGQTVLHMWGFENSVGQLHEGKNGQEGIFSGKHRLWEVWSNHILCLQQKVWCIWPILVTGFDVFQ